MQPRKISQLLKQDIFKGVVRYSRDALVGLMELNRMILTDNSLLLYRAFTKDNDFFHTAEGRETKLRIQEQEDEIENVINYHKDTLRRLYTQFQMWQQPCAKTFKILTEKECVRENKKIFVQPRIKQDDRKGRKLG